MKKYIQPAIRVRKIMPTAILQISNPETGFTFVGTTSGGSTETELDDNGDGVDAGMAKVTWGNCWDE